MELDPRRAVHELARHLTPKPPARVPQFDVGRVWLWVRLLPVNTLAHHALMKFAGWLWKSGTRDMDAVMVILEDRVRRNPRNPYMYYAPRSSARLCQAYTVAIKKAEIANSRLKAEERAWLAGK